MNTRIVAGAALCAVGVIVLGQLTVGASTGTQSDQGAAGPEAAYDAAEFLETGCVPSGPPDVYCLKVDGLENWSDTTYRAYSVGTTSCNQGQSPLQWHANDNMHPVIGQNMYRLRPDPVNGHPRFEQIGQSWLKHGFCALDLTECGSCCGTGCISLGIGCSDPYTAARNGSQGSAGPKWQVNATTGFFPYPPANPSWSGSTDRRLRVLKTDVEAASNPGAVYYLEAQYVHPEDNPSTGVTAAGNNVSYREVTLNSSGVATGYVGSTVTQKPAVVAWGGATIQRIAVPGEGTIRVAYTAYDNGDGTWDYEYAVHNLDFDRGVQSFGVPVPAGVTVTNIGFHDVDYHSHDGLNNVTFDGTDWPGVHSGGEVRWSTSTYDQDQNANALRWGTLYNFRFTADSAPDISTASVDFFKPGSPASQTVPVRGPGAIADCPADIDGSGDVGFDDLLDVLSNWGPCIGCPQDIDGDDQVGFSDLLGVLSTWGPCP
jgi:hypothetical protein